jgi:3-oxoacyl-[acyl-carrier protein] reductase
MEQKSRVALVTGAGRGIGLAVARRLAAEGAAVVVADLDVDGARAAAEDIAGRGGLARAVEMDVRREGDWRRAVEEALAWQGALHVLVNNAGFDRPGGVQKASRADWEAVLEVHLTGCFLGMQAAVPAMRQAGWGRIVNVSSIYAKFGGQGEAAYTAAKAGMVGLTKSAAQELARHGILVNCVLPGLTDTPAIRRMMAPHIRDKILAQTPLRRMARPEEIAAVVAFLCSEDASFVCGAAWEVTGGWQM